MVAMNHRIVNTVINRCKMPSDGDILVPAHTVSVIGTTDVKISDPDHFAIEPWEVHLCLEEGDKLVPGFKDMRMLRAWAGVRPLYQESQVSDTRDVTRAFVLLDHEKRDGVSGIVTITSGKWTTYRKMAEVTVDLVCQKLSTQRPCRTHLEPLPEASHGHHYLGGKLRRIEADEAYGQLVCECELATYADVTHAIVERQARTIDDVRRDVRLGMGPCQGGFCTYRVAGILHHLASSQANGSKPRVEDTNVALRDFLQERWKGLLPVLWGQQLRQERLDELIYLDVFNADHLPGPQSSRLGPNVRNFRG
jgi:glycerol-3-phosphate dehydrogenase